MYFRILIAWIITAIAVATAVIVLQWINPAWVTLTGTNAWVAVLIMAAVLGLVNAVIRPILQFLSCGCIVATLGLFLLVINAFTLWLSGAISALLNTGFSINGFWPALIGGLIISIVSFVLNMFIVDEQAPGADSGGASGTTPR